MPKIPLLLVLASAMVSSGCSHDSHAKGQSHSHGGIPYVTTSLSGGGDVVGVAHLKLHDDRGDLELWVYGEKAVVPLGLSLDAAPRLTFFDIGPDGSHRTVTLGPRDLEQNPDEDGKANIVDGRTHYFIYPRGGEDSEWLKGTDFKCDVLIEIDEGSWASERFELVPHGDGAHSH